MAIAARRRPAPRLAAPALLLLVWSGGYAFAKIGLQHSGPLTLLAIRYTLLIVHEQLPALAWAGMALAAAGVALATLWPRPEAAP